MYVSVKTALAMIKRRRGQSIIIGLILTLTAILMFTGISLLNTSKPFEDMYERAKGSHTILLANKGLHDYDKIVSWWENQKGVENVNIIETLDVKAEIKRDKQIQFVDATFAEYNPDRKYDIIFNDKEEVPKELSKNQIYVNTAFAKQYQLRKNDDVKFTIYDKTVILRVADIIVDPQYSSILNSSRLWTAEGFLEDYNGARGAEIGIRHVNYNKKTAASLIEDFESYTTKDFPVYIINFDTIRLAYSMLFSVISAVLLLVSVIMIIIVTFIIRNTISNSIIDNYKSIGVMKATGYSSMNIVSIYTLMFSLIALISTVVGIVIGHWVQVVILNTLKEALNVPVNRGVLIPGILTILVLQTLVLIFACLSARKGIKIKPVQAIKYGMPEDKTSSTKILLKHLDKLPISLLLATKQIAAKSRQSIVIVASLSFIIFLSISMISLLDTFKGEEVIEYFTSMPTGDMTISYDGPDSKEKILSELKDMDEISHAIYSVHSIDSSVYSNKTRKQISITRTMILGNTDSFGISLSKGRIPRIGNEILITSQLAQETGKDVGDYTEIKSAQGTKKYLITGLYQSVMNMGLAYTVAYSEDRAHMIENVQAGYTVKFSDSSITYGEVEKLLHSKYGDQIDVKRLDETSQTVKDMTGQLPPVFLLLIGIFYIVCGASVMNWTLMDIKRSSKMYGILKASGLSNVNIMQMMAAKAMILTSFACIIGSLAGIYAAPSLLKTIFAVTPYNISNIQVQSSSASLIITITFYLVITLITTLIPARKIRNITPRVLIVD